MFLISLLYIYSYIYVNICIYFLYNVRVCMCRYIQLAVYLCIYLFLWMYLYVIWYLLACPSKKCECSLVYQHGGSSVSHVSCSVNTGFWLYIVHIFANLKMNNQGIPKTSLPKTATMQQIWFCFACGKTAKHQIQFKNKWKHIQRFGSKITKCTKCFQCIFNYALQLLHKSLRFFYDFHNQHCSKLLEIARNCQLIFLPHFQNSQIQTKVD